METFYRAVSASFMDMNCTASTAGRRTVYYMLVSIDMQTNGLWGLSFIKANFYFVPLPPPLSISILIL